MSFQQKCLNRMSEVTSRGRTLLFVSHSTASITQFCNRCIWLDSGRIVADGIVAEVIDNYVKASGLVSSTFTPDKSQIRSKFNRRQADQKIDDEYLPCELVRLHTAEITNKHGDLVSNVNVEEEVHIHIVFEVLSSGHAIEPALHIKNSEQKIIFVVAFADTPQDEGFNNIGIFSTTCRIPAHLLNTGIHHVDVQIVTPTSPIQRHVKYDNAISFHVNEAQFGRLSARGRYGNWHIPGAVRPMLKWKVEAINPSELKIMSSVSTSKKNISEME
jgi:lipopolysaccharide transport system ATP-binding protein